MAKYVIVTLDEVSMFSRSLEHDLARLDDAPVDSHRLLERVNAMIESLVDAAHQPRQLDDIYDYLVDEYGECLSALYVLEQLMEVCQRHLNDHSRTPTARLASIRVLDCRGDAVLTIA